MRRLALVLGLLSAGLAAAGEAQPRCEPNAIQLTTISLADQNNQPRVFSFPQPRVSVLTVADHKGSDQIEFWLRALKTRYSSSLLVEGVADVSSVPAPLRPFVRKRFRDAFAHPVMLDWKGHVVRQLKATQDVANIYALSTNGVVLLSLCGAANPTNLAELFSVLDANGAVATTNLQQARVSPSP